MTFIPTSELEWTATYSGHLIGEPDDQLTHWSVALRVNLEDDDPDPIVATGEFWIGDDYEQFDACSQEVADAAEIMLDGDYEDEVRGLVVAARIEVVPEFRGQLLGPLLMAESLLRIAQMDPEITVIGEPAPYQINDESSPEYAAEKARLWRMWAQIGFERYSDRFCVLELPGEAAIAAKEALLKLREAAR